MPICFTKEQYEKVKEYAKRHGMLNASQAIESVLNEE